MIGTYFRFCQFCDKGLQSRSRCENNIEYVDQWHWTGVVFHILKTIDLGTEKILSFRYKEMENNVALFGITTKTKVPLGTEHLFVCFVQLMFGIESKAVVVWPRGVATSFATFLYGDVSGVHGAQLIPEGE